VLVNGGPDALLQLTGQRVLAPSAPAVLAGDRLPVRPALWAVTDSLRRADSAFGLIDPTVSYTYTATETNPVDDPLGSPGGAPRQLLPVPGAARRQTVAVLVGAASVTASSSGSWLAETPQIDPVNAFDGNRSTVWAEANPATAVGQWVQIRFDHRVVLPDTIGITLLDDISTRPVPSRLEVRTDAGIRTSWVRRTGAWQPLAVPPGPTSGLRITIAGVRGGVPGGPGAGFAGVSIPGVTVTRYLKPAQDSAGASAAATAFSFQRPVPSPASLADVAAYPPMARSFVTDGADPFTLRASAIAVPGTALDTILTGLTPVRRSTLEVTASSTYGSLPSLAPANLFRRDRPGAWIAGGEHATLRLSWPGARTISQMTIQPLPGFAAAPETVKITSPHGTRFASVGLGGLSVIVPPLRTSRMTISFPVVQFATTAQPISGQPLRLPVGLSGLSIPALHGLRPATLEPRTRFSLRCGSGPPVTIDGHTLPTRVFGRVGALIGFQPVHVRLCAPGSAIRLGGGRHWLISAGRRAFTITDLSLIGAGPSGQPATAPQRAQGLESRVAGAGQAAAASAQAGRQVRVLAWDSEYRRVRVGGGAAAYLEVHQNANPGWSATLHGRALTAVRLDGWQQGFVVPAGRGGVVTLTFNPAKFYHVWIILSAAGALGLVLAAFAGQRRGRVRGQMVRASPAGIPAGPVPASPVPAGPVPAGSVPAGTVGASPVGTRPVPAGPVPVGSVSAGPVLAGPWWRLWAGLLALAALLAIVGGPMVLAVPVVAVLAYRWPGWYGAVAVAAMTSAGVLTALAAHPSLLGVGAFGAPAQACALVALTCALMPVLPGRGSWWWS
jgi:arabinofuranan 3-O-arabinosyltransferase